VRIDNAFVNNPYSLSSGVTVWFKISGWTNPPNSNPAAFTITSYEAKEDQMVDKITTLTITAVEGELSI